MTTPTLADMKLPMAADLPPLRIVELPRVAGPGVLGAKVPANPSCHRGPAIANAIADVAGVQCGSAALGRARFQCDCRA